MSDQLGEDHRINGELRGCEKPTCGLLPDCAGNRPWMRAAAQRKLDAIHNGTIHDCCRPRSDAEYLALVAATLRK